MSYAILGAIRAPLSVFLAFFITASSAAQERDTIPTELSEIVIKAYGFSSFANSTTSSSGLLIEQVALTRPEKVTDGLTLLPGVYSAPDGIGGQMLNIRGFDQNQVNVYFNGIPLKSNTENKISLDGLFFTYTDISIEKGNASLIYGANSSGNVIRIDNRIMSNEKYMVKINTFLGNNGKQGCNILFQGNIKKKLYFQTSCNYYKRKSFVLSNNFDTSINQPTHDRDNSDQENIELLGTLTYTLNNNNHLSATVIHNTSKFGYPASTYVPRFRRMDYWRNTILGLRHHMLINKKIKIETSLYFTHLFDTLNQYKDKTYSSVRSISHWDDITMGAKSILSYSIKNNSTVNFSLDYKNDNHSQAWFTTATTKANTLIMVLEYQDIFFKRIFVNAGGAYNFINPNYTSKNENITRHDLSAFNCQFSSAYSPLKRTYKIHLGYSRTSIFPRMRDLFGDALIGYVPNSTLKSELCDNFDVGINQEFLNKKINLQLSSYHSSIKNLLTQVKVTDTTNQIVNLQSSVFYGIELMLKYFPNKKIFGLISNSLLNAKNNSINRLSNNIAYRPKNRLKTFISYTPIKYVGIDLTYTFVSKMLYTDTKNNWLAISDHSVFDIGIKTSPIKYLTAWFKINNLFDKDYVSSFDQPQPGREYRIGLTLELISSGE